MPHFCHVVDRRMGQISLPATLIIVTFTSRGLLRCACGWMVSASSEMLSFETLRSHLWSLPGSSLCHKRHVRITLRVSWFGTVPARVSASFNTVPSRTNQHVSVSLQAVCQLARGAVNVTAQNWWIQYEKYYLSTTDAASASDHSVVTGVKL